RARTIASSGVRRRTDGARPHRVQGPPPARHRGHLSELRYSLRGLESKGAADRRQRPHALFHRTPAPTARSGHGSAGRPLAAGAGTMSFIKRLGASRAVQHMAGVLAAEYLRLVWKTNRFVLEPADFYERV